MAATAQSQVAQLCFGAGPEQLNLKAVQQRIAELIRVIDSLLVEMQTQGAHWISFLDKLAVVNVLHTQVMSEVRPLLRQYVIYPQYVDNPGIENSIPELLASRLLPEQLQQEAGWRAELPGGLAQLAAAPSICLDYADSQIVELQELVGWLTNVAHVIKARDNTTNPTPRELAVGVLDPKGKPRREVDALSREITLAAAAAAAAREQAGGSLAGTHQQGVTSVVVGHKRPRPGSAGAAAAPTPEAAKNSDEAVDALLAKIVSGALWPRPQAGTR